MASKKKKIIRCMECPRIATKVVNELNVGLCEQHAKELLTAAILVKMVNGDSSRKKYIRKSKQK